MPRARKPDPEVRLPADLVGPVDLELGRAVDTIPGPNALPGGSRYEPKWDGLVGPASSAAEKGTDLVAATQGPPDRFPDIAAAAARQLRDGCVLDGELVILGADGRLSFDTLQRRLVTSPAKARNLVATVPASYVAFDLLAIGGVDLRTQRWTVRRRRLEQLAAAWALPMQLSPVTDDLEEAQERFDVLPEAMGSRAWS
jgi:hypothetical protein